MSDTVQCPYGNDKCPQYIGVSAEVKNLSDKMDLQNKYVIDKIDDIATDVKEVKNFLNEGLDKKIDERIEAAWAKKVAAMTKWIVTSVIGSSGLTALITLLISK